MTKEETNKHEELDGKVAEIIASSQLPDMTVRVTNTTEDEDCKSVSVVGAFGRGIICNGYKLIHQVWPQHTISHRTDDAYMSELTRSLLWAQLMGYADDEGYGYYMLYNMPCHVDAALEDNVIEFRLNARAIDTEAHKAYAAIKDDEIDFWDCTDITARDVAHCIDADILPAKMLGVTDFEYWREGYADAAGKLLKEKDITLGGLVPVMNSETLEAIHCALRFDCIEPPFHGDVPVLFGVPVVINDLCIRGEVLFTLPEEESS